MADSVTMTWIDGTGSYTSTFSIDNPTLADVKAAYTAQTGMILPVDEEGRELKQTDDEFYASLSHQLVHQTLNFAQGYKNQQAVAAVPPIEFAAGAPAGTRAAAARR